jgi:pyrroloquinoline quinone (PQQ) biosynthesis protein C
MLSTQHSEDLWSKIRLAEGRLTSASDRFWNHPELASLLPEFLIQLHGVMRSGLALMKTANERAQAMSGDPTSQQIAAYLQHHIQEETGHDQWLLDDLESIGISRVRVLSTPPCAAVVSLLGAQYYWIFHAHPVAVFGYLIVLEGNPPLAKQLEEIRARIGYPASAFRCLMAHAEDDPGHLDALNRTLDAMPLTPEQSRMVAISAFHTIDAVASLFEELIENYSACQPSQPSTELTHA